MTANDTISIAMILSVGSFVVALVGVILNARKQSKEDAEYKEKTIVYVTKRTNPTIWFEYNNTLYDPNNCYYELYSLIDFPDLYYEWNDCEGNFISAYYAEDEEDKGTERKKYIADKKIFHIEEVHFAHK